MIDYLFRYFNHLFTFVNFQFVNIDFTSICGNNII